MSTKLYVGGISYGTSEEKLKEHFSSAGTVVSAQIIIDRQTGRSKGFGFVEMASDEDAQKAIETLNNQDLEGRKLTVNEARPKEERPRNNGGFNRSRY